MASSNAMGHTKGIIGTTSGPTIMAASNPVLAN